MQKQTISDLLPGRRVSMQYSHAGYGGSYFSPPWLWLLALNFDHAAMREPGNSYARDEAAWERLYQKTLDIVNKRLIERGLPQIKAVSASMPARA